MSGFPTDRAPSPLDAVSLRCPLHPTTKPIPCRNKPCPVPRHRPCSPRPLPAIAVLFIVPGLPATYVTERPTPLRFTQPRHPFPPAPASAPAPAAHPDTDRYTRLPPAPPPTPTAREVHPPPPPCAPPARRHKCRPTCPPACCPLSCTFITACARVPAAFLSCARAPSSSQALPRKATRGHAHAIHPSAAPLLESRGRVSF
jgi:hypothetical protein